MSNVQKVQIIQSKGINNVPKARKKWLQGNTHAMYKKSQMCRGLTRQWGWGKGNQWQGAQHRHKGKGKAQIKGLGKGSSRHKGKGRQVKAWQGHVVGWGGRHTVGRGQGHKAGGRARRPQVDKGKGHKHTTTGIHTLLLVSHVTRQ